MHVKQRLPYINFVQHWGKRIETISYYVKAAIRKMLLNARQLTKEWDTALKRVKIFIYPFTTFSLTNFVIYFRVYQKTLF